MKMSDLIEVCLPFETLNIYQGRRFVCATKAEDLPKRFLDKEISHLGAAGSEMLVGLKKE